MLNLTVKCGEYFLIGDDIKVIFTGGTANNARIMIDAPRTYNIVRGKVLEKTQENEGQGGGKDRYYPEPPIPEDKFQRIMERQRQREEQLARIRAAEKKNQNRKRINGQGEKQGKGCREAMRA